jgi:hypothetical protein
LGEVRCEEFLYELKAGPAGGRLRRPSSAGGGLPSAPVLTRIVVLTFLDANQRLIWIRIHQGFLLDTGIL